MTMKVDVDTSEIVKMLESLGRMADSFKKAVDDSLKEFCKTNLKEKPKEPDLKERIKTVLGDTHDIYPEVIVNVSDERKQLLGDLVMFTYNKTNTGKGCMDIIKELGIEEN